MSIVNAIARGIFKPKALSVTEEKAWFPSLWNLIGGRTDSGVSVTEHSALTFSAVYCAINLIAGTIGTLPLHLYRRQGKRNVPATDMNLYRLMHDEANPYMTAADLRETMTAHVLAWGNGYAEIVRNRVGQVVQLWPIPPDRVSLKMKNARVVYEITVDGETVELDRDKVLHLHGLGFDGFQGYSIIRMARQSIGLGLAMEEFGARFFGNGTHPGVIVEHPGKLSEQAHNNLKNDLTQKHSGLGKSHRMMLLEEGMKLQNIGIPPEDAQFLESRQHQIPEIARWFNLPPHKLRDLTRASFNNIESEQISFVVDSILPWLVRFEQAYKMQLLRSSEKKNDTLYFKHNVDGHLRGDAASRGAFYREMWNIGAYSINDIREKEDDDPIDGGDQHFVPMNMVPLDRALKDNGGTDNEASNQTPAGGASAGKKLPRGKQGRK